MSILVPHNHESQNPNRPISEHPKNSNLNTPISIPYPPTFPPQIHHHPIPMPSLPHPNGPRPVRYTDDPNLDAPRTPSMTRASAALKPQKPRKHAVPLVGGARASLAAARYVSDLPHRCASASIAISGWHATRLGRDGGGRGKEGWGVKREGVPFALVGAQTYLQNIGAVGMVGMVRTVSTVRILRSLSFCGGSDTVSCVRETHTRSRRQRDALASRVRGRNWLCGR